MTINSVHEPGLSGVPFLPFPDSVQPIICEFLPPEYLSAPCSHHHHHHPVIVEPCIGCPRCALPPPACFPYGSQKDLSRIHILSPHTLCQTSLGLPLALSTPARIFPMSCLLALALPPQPHFARCPFCPFPPFPGPRVHPVPSFPRASAWAVLLPPFTFSSSRFQLTFPFLGGVIPDLPTVRVPRS